MALPDFKVFQNFKFPKARIRFHAGGGYEIELKHMNQIEITTLITQLNRDNYL